jgi:hypothetical protein
LYGKNRASEYGTYHGEKKKQIVISFPVKSQTGKIQILKTNVG